MWQIAVLAAVSSGVCVFLLVLLARAVIGYRKEPTADYAMRSVVIEYVACPECNRVRRQQYCV